MDETQKAIIETMTTVIQNMCKEWERAFDKTDNVHWALTKVLDELAHNYTVTYQPWSWALEQILLGNRVRWKNWSPDSFVERDGNFIRRHSLLHGELKRRIVNFEPSIDKLTENGWTLWVPTSIPEDMED